MVEPIWIFVVFLGAAFLIALLDKIGRWLSEIVMQAALLVNVFISFQWFFNIAFKGFPPKMIFTAGFKPPFSINLRMGLEESFIMFFVSIVAYLVSLFLFDKFRKIKVYALPLYLMMIMGINGIIMTRDLFNLFVFLEIASISTYALITFKEDLHSLSAGFKYMIAGGLSSAFFLIGTIFIYNLTGTLNIDDIIAHKAMLSSSLGFLAVFILFISLVIELKPFPANGWALDVYQATNPGITSIIAVANSAAVFYAVYKILPLIDNQYLTYVAGIGIVSFFFTNLLAIKQYDVQRLLGYSSVGQIGLLLAATALTRYIGLDNKTTMFILVGFFLSNFFAKSGLFWLAGIVKEKDLRNWKLSTKDTTLILFFGVFILALAGMPPLPGFWAKWEFIKALMATKLYLWVGFILLGSLFEVFYMFRWLGKAIRPADAKHAGSKIFRTFPVFVSLLGLLGLSFATLVLKYEFKFFQILPIYAMVVMYIIDFIPAKIKGLISIAGLGYYFYMLLPELHGISLFFGAVFILGSTVQIISTLNRKKISSGFYPLLVGLITSLGAIVIASSKLTFFLNWEIMTITSYLLILRGKKAPEAALKYIVFSTGGAFLIMTGLLSTSTPFFGLSKFMLPDIGLVGLFLMSLGFLIKSGALGFHVWLPGAYAEADDDFTSMISSVLSKVGVFGIFLVALLAVVQSFNSDVLMHFISWIGILTVFFGALMAVFQEDIKYLLAYSSMSQVGYIILSFTTLSHLGWLAGMYLTLNHFLFKGMLFLAVAGIISRINTRNMYEMGGLIKKMPLTFISVLIAIIAVSGVPPLSGFGSKWLIYTALIEKGWYFRAGLAMFSSAIAFLYLFRLIHTMFLGQPKPIHKDVKEANALYLIPQFIFLMVIMAISTFPSLILKPLSSYIAPILPSTVSWDGNTLISSLGYWNGNLVMYVTMGVFALPLVWLFLTIGQVQKVKQFNMVFAAERPFRPEVTHVAHNFFAHYQKALGFMIKPKITGFWNMIGEWLRSIAASIRQIYSGNGQTYILHILMYIVILYFIMGGRS